MGHFRPAGKGSRSSLKRAGSSPWEHDEGVGQRVVGQVLDDIGETAVGELLQGFVARHIALRGDTRVGLKAAGDLSASPRARPFGS